MKLTFFLGLTTFMAIQWVSAQNMNRTVTVTTTSLTPSKGRFVEMLGKRLKHLWTQFAAEDNSDSFIGRCFGVARKLKFAMPLIIFKLGVIVTVLAFLTIFSLKTLSLLAFLVLLNVSGAMTKLAVAFSGKGHAESKHWSPPQNVHLHVHQTKDGNFDLGHTTGGWDDRLGKYGTSSEELDSIETSNLYNRFNLNGIMLRNRGYLDR